MFLSGLHAAAVILVSSSGIAIGAPQRVCAGAGAIVHSHVIGPAGACRTPGVAASGVKSRTAAAAAIL